MKDPSCRALNIWTPTTRTPNSETNLLMVAHMKLLGLLSAKNGTGLQKLYRQCIDVCIYVHMYIRIYAYTHVCMHVSDLLP